MYIAAIGDDSALETGSPLVACILYFFELVDPKNTPQLRKAISQSGA